MTFAFGSFTLGAALLVSAFKNQSLLSLILGEKGQSISSQGESHPSSEGGSVASGGNEIAAFAGSNSGYVSPLTSQATTGRIDQGQDFGGSGAVRAIGDAKIVRTGAPGWPGGKGVEYKLLNGPAKGRCVYVYEGIHVTVRSGQTVKAGSVIGTIIPGSSTGIEMGWSDCHGVPISHGEYTEGKETKAGKGFAQFLKSIGGP